MGAVTAFPLPQDMVEAILLRLPVRSLLRLKAVSEEFRSLISSSNFISNHSSKTSLSPIVTQSLFRGSSCFLLQNDPETVHAPVLEILDDQHLGVDYFRLVGSANGLVCIQSGYILENSEKGVLYMLWNPATRQSKRIQHPSSIRGDLLRLIGFGYHCGIQDDYKLLGIPLRGFGSRSRSMHVFSLRRGTWREIEYCCIKPHQRYFYCCAPSSSVVLNGIWYSLVESSSSGEEDEETQINFEGGVLTFDMDKESTALVSLPAGLSHSHHKFNYPNQVLGVRDQKLWLFSLSDEGALEVWVIDQMETSSWTKKYTTAGLLFCAGFKGVYWQGTRVLLDGCMTSPNELMRTWSYDLLTRTWRQIGAPPIIIYENCDHIESLVPPFWPEDDSR